MSLKLYLHFTFQLLDPTDSFLHIQPRKYLTLRQGIKFKGVHYKVKKTKVVTMKYISPASFPLFMPLLPPFLRGAHDPCLLEGFFFFADYLNFEGKKSIAHSDE